jgi:hypothetical protein
MIKSILVGTCDHGYFCFGKERRTEREFRTLRRKMAEKGKRIYRKKNKRKSYRDWKN